MLGPRFCARAFSSCGKRGPLLIAVRGPLTIAASLVAEHKLQTRRLSSCGPRAQLLRGTRDPPRPGLEPVSPALAGRLSTAAPPGKPYTSFLKVFIYLFIYLFLAALGLCCCMRAFSSCRLLFVVVHGLLIVVATLRCGAWASHCGGFSCCGARALGAGASVVVAHGLCSCGSWALEHRLSSCDARA